MLNSFNFINNKIDQKNNYILASRFLFDAVQKKKFPKTFFINVFFINLFCLIKILFKIHFNFLIQIDSINIIKKKVIYKRSNLIISHKNLSDNSDYIFGDNFGENFKLKTNFIYVNNIKSDSKYLKISKDIQLFNYFFQLKTIIKLFKISLSFLFSYDPEKYDLYDKNFLNHLSLSYLKEDTFYNVIIFEFIKKNILLSECKNIVTTYEGHPWEILLFFYSKDFKSVSIFAYLHSYLKTNSPYLHLHLKFQPNYLYVVGEIMKKKVLDNLPFQKNQIITLGSKKFSFNKYSNNDLSRKKFRNILLLPESIDEEVQLFLNFIDIYKKNESLNIKIKLHPLYEMNNLDFIKYKKYIINGNLETILKNFELIVYRGTSSIFEIIHNDVFCLYLYDKEKIINNPLSINSPDLFIDINNKNSLFQAEQNLINNEFILDKYKKVKNKFNYYYEPFNNNLLP